MLTTREHLAGMAMQGLLAEKGWSEHLASSAVQIADDLIAELERSSPSNT